MSPIACVSLATIIALLILPASSEEWSELNSAGPYLGQPLPGETSVQFAPGLIDANLHGW